MPLKRIHEDYQILWQIYLKLTLNPYTLFTFPTITNALQNLIYSGPVVIIIIITYCSEN